MLPHKRANYIPYAERGAGVQGWEELINAIAADYPTTANSAAENLACPDFNIPRFYLAPGRVLRYCLTGSIGVVAAANTLTLRVRWGGVAGILLGSSGVVNLATTGGTFGFRWEGEISCRASGPTGLLMHCGLATFSNRLYSVPPLAAELVPIMFSQGSGGAAQANVPVQVDTTTDKLLSFSAQYGTANAANVLTTQQALLEALN